MTKEEAIEVIKSNWPPGNYTMLRDALEIAIKALEGKRIAELEKELILSRMDNYKLLDGIGE